MKHPHPERTMLGETCVCWAFGDVIDPDLSVQVLAAYRAIKSSATLRELGVADVVPSYTSLAVHLTQISADHVRAVINCVESMIESLSDLPETTSGTRLSALPVIYDGEDIERVARHNGLEMDDVPRLHSVAEYRIAMIGFLPHFPYLLGLDPRLETPRLDKPRTRVPSGAVAIGGGQTGVYPSASPGGWNLIGRTRPELLQSLKPGGRVCFKPRRSLVLINCDIGERGADHPQDLKLMRHIDIANIACGGHAGDAASARAFSELAAAYGVQACAHLSYPDREHFGRRSMSMPVDKLLNALTKQRDMLPEVNMLKFHGALYHDAAQDSNLAHALAAWAVRAGFNIVLAPHESAMASAAQAAGLHVMTEAFAERGYQWINGRLTLVSREHEHAEIKTVEAALEQCRSIIDEQTITAYTDESGTVTCAHEMASDTLCVHSDSVIALALVKALERMLQP